MLRNLLNDDYGVIISAELVFVLTILVIGMVVGLSEVQHAVVQELDDISNAIGKVNQSFLFSGFRGVKTKGTTSGNTKSFTRGSVFIDLDDDCDGPAGNACANGSSDVACAPPIPEGDCDGI